MNNSNILTLTLIFNYIITTQAFASSQCDNIANFLQTKHHYGNIQTTSTKQSCKLSINGKYYNKRADEDLREYFIKAGYIEDINQAADGIDGTQFVFQTNSTICTTQASWNYGGLGLPPPTKYKLELDCVYKKPNNP